MNKIENFIKYISHNNEVQRLVITHMSIIVIFAVIYKEINNDNYDSFSNKEEMDMFDCIYYSAITHTTVGFGDISPLTKKARTATIIHVLLVFLIGFMDMNDVI